MKKVTFIAAVVMAVAFTSCKKDYTCTCTVLGTSTTTTYEKLSKKDAEEVETTCNNADAAAKIVGGSCKWAQK